MKKSILFLFILTIVLISCKKDEEETNNMPQQSDGLMAYYPFNGNANDESGKDNNGITNGASLAFDRFGENDKAYSFDGINDFIEVLNSSSLNFGNSTDFTLCTWVKFSDLNVSTSWFVPFIFKRDYYNSVLQGYGLGTIGNKAASEIATSWGNLSQPNGLSGSTLVNNNIWRFIVLTVSRSSQNAKIYIDSNLECDLLHESLQLDIDNTASLFFGAPIGAASDRFFKGYLDDIRIYNIALSNTKILDLYHEGGWPILNDGLIAYYPFNGNANDESGNGNNGAVAGASLVVDRFGNQNSAYYFDGQDDLIAVPNSTSLSITGDITISAWIFDNGISSSSYHTIINKRVSNLWSYNMSISYIDGGSGQENNKMMSARRNSNSDWDYKFSNESINTNTWQHWVITISNDEITFYKNGENAGYLSVFGNDFTIPSINQICDVVIGSNNQNGEWFYGNLDDIRIHNKALNESEIQELYHEGGW